METKKNPKVSLYDLIEPAYLAGKSSVDFYLDLNDFCYTAKVSDIETWSDPVLVKLEMFEETIHYTFPAYIKVYPA